MTQQMIAQCHICEEWVHKDQYVDWLQACRDCVDLAQARAEVDDEFMFAMTKVLTGEWESMLGHPSYAKNGGILWTPPARGHKRRPKFSS